MDTGPDARGDYDLALTELLEPEHRFVVRVGSELGRSLLEDVPCIRWRALTTSPSVTHSSSAPGKR